ncbi:PAS domain S-box protein [Antarcticibacterium arcticum]|uniref:PAS domain S-box protein n=1 Tax=Antarcticibacterium arcticum TaxID=2585771 RepID=A0A5B8YIB1_9FLAO|nr:CheR family methyltransferase [Antarcticibacterium arcticum]QED36567.1 PAS domain S-box protein [Antarcticibacterium arcticum]
MTKNHSLASSDISVSNLTTSRIIAVGASAGGLEALKSFFQNIPTGDMNSYVVIQHLSPDYKSMMGELLAKSTKLKIEEIKDNMEILPGRIYLIPPVNNLVIENGMLHLLDKPKDQKLNLPIDMFLQSLAEFKKEQAIAIILSGTGSDGSRGIRAIKEQEGMVMVQDPEEAKFDGMPKSAIHTGLVDYIVGVEEMGAELQNFINAPVVLHFTEDDIEYDENTLAKILHLVNEKTGLDFREYKHSTLARRVARRVSVCKCSSLKEYLLLLESNPEEIPILYREFLIGVTKFFRDSRVWDILRDEVIPALITPKKDGEVLKIWDVACSTGEEAYSLGMLLNEEMERQGKNLDIKIFATDISKKHLDIGSLGIYSESIVADVEMHLLQKYFISKSKGYQVVEKVRRMVIFSKHNVLKNPPFSNMEMILCRNLLIYFQPSIQKRALNVLHYGLKENGILVLGTSESVQTHREYFEDVNRKWKIYRNVNPRKRLNAENLHSSPSRLLENVPSGRQREIKPTTSGSKQKFYAELSEAILEQFGGASVFVDSEYNILQAFGEFRKYASLPVNGFSINLTDMLGQDLKHIVQATVKKAERINQKTIYRDASFQHNGEMKGLDLLVKPFRQHNLDNEINFAITFIEKEIRPENLKEVEKVTLTSRTREYIQELEEELKKTKEELQTSLEEIETSNEELQAANEELLASNEELQSTNEELQSVNEEINTVNAENVQKMDDLAGLNADMNNLLESIDIGTIFLDNSLRIRKFTPAVKRHFSLIGTDIGRPIENFTTNFGAHKGRKGLVERCKKVMETGKKIERHIISKEGHHYLQRISPFINSNQKIEGVVITFVDIETLQKAQDRLVASEKRFKSFYEKDPILHFSVDPNTSLIIECNEKAIEKMGYSSKEDLIGRPLFELYDDASQLKAVKLNKLFQQNGELNNIEQELITKDGEKLPVIMSSRVERDEENKVVSNRFTCVDISELKEAQNRLKKKKVALERANKDLEQFVSICSHDLQEPLATIKFGSDILGKIYANKLDDKGREYISYIDAASDRLANQIRALLEHSKIGKNSDRTLVNTKELVEVVKYDLSKRIRDTKAQIHVGALPKIKAYQVELRLLFQNLISNALKYISEERSPEIRISAYPEGEFWVFAIVDNGIGISEEDQKNIFTIFSRVPTQRKYEGTGVGLAHAEKIVLLHEGSIWVDSQVGVGSTFYFKIKTS